MIHHTGIPSLEHSINDSVMHQQNSECRPLQTNTFKAWWKKPCKFLRYVLFPIVFLSARLFPRFNILSLHSHTCDLRRTTCNNQEKCSQPSPLISTPIPPPLLMRHATKSLHGANLSHSYVYEQCTLLESTIFLLPVIRMAQHAMFCQLEFPKVIFKVWSYQSLDF